MTPQEQLEIIAAYVAGEVIQFLAPQRVGWTDIVVSDMHAFNFEELQYRKKPKPLEFWVNLYPDGPGSPYASKKDALAAKKDYSEARTVRVREVVDDNL